MPKIKNSWISLTLSTAVQLIMLMIFTIFLIFGMKFDRVAEPCNAEHCWLSEWRNFWYFLAVFYYVVAVPAPAVFWHCWLVVRKTIRPVKKFSDEVLVRLSVWIEVHMICIRSSWCYCHPVISHFIKIQIGLTFLVLAYPGCPGK